MKRTIKVILSAVVLSSMLSGCVIWPWWGDEGHGHGHYHGERGDWHGGEHEGRR
ncbi:hypothetical protein [Geomesophilobacter sediminis]|uniref:Lipoprotein n=1 Tax=Geomesophilobacter sediminis TaxID=2798584 RepID=A0A8J7IXE6_9BACT|nr:hypothetical protein [Geomesophilobacter sediminis]MBJ6724547.1 hypothetical protein [Geomesophilobacter sediminis]